MNEVETVSLATRSSRRVERKACDNEEQLFKNAVQRTPLSGVRLRNAYVKTRMPAV